MNAAWRSLPRFNQTVLLLTSLTLSAALVSCDRTTTQQYQASATTTYTWQVEYQGTGGGAGERPPRIEKFAASELVNENGQQPEGAVTGPDDQGLWWGGLPPRPTVNQLEAKQRSQEVIGTPKLRKSIDYTVTFRLPGGNNQTLPTRYEVYRKVVRAYKDRIPLEFTLDPAQNSVLKAEPALPPLE